MLHITNGTAAADRIRASGFGGQIITWDDALHEGPVPADLDLVEFRAVRARFIAEQGWAGEHEAYTALTRRDAALDACEAHDEVVLWFESDLYDQLQLTQILDRFATLPTTPPVSLIQVDRLGNDARFGLGRAYPSEFSDLFRQRVQLDATTFTRARRTWRAFGGPHHLRLAEQAAHLTPDLPYLPAAIWRLFEEYPAIDTGLGRTERDILEILERAEMTGIDLFLSVQEQEARPFLGDSVFWSRLSRLMSNTDSLIAWESNRSRAGVLPHSFAEARFRLTDLGRQVISGAADWLQFKPIDRWIGGVHLLGSHPGWRWDGANRRIVASG